MEGREEGRQSTAMAGISDLCERVGRRNVCPWLKDSEPKADKSFLDYLFLFYSLCVTLVPYFSSQNFPVLKQSLFSPQHEN